jgi:hypothetical protein
MIKRITLSIARVVLALMCTPIVTAIAQDFPSKPVRGRRFSARRWRGYDRAYRRAEVE